MKTQLMIVSIAAVLLAVATGVGFWMYFDTKTELAGTEAQLTDAEAELEAIADKYPLKNFASKAELEDWKDSHRLPHAYSDDEQFDNAMQTQITAMNNGYLVSIQMDYFTDEDLWWIGNSAIAGDVVYHFKVDGDEMYAYDFP
jgi:hypothetical protein